MKRSFLLVSILMLLLIVSSVSAQSVMMAYCGDLSEEDCAILMGVQVPDSASFDGEAVFNVFIGDVAYSVPMTLEGEYIANREVIDRFMGMYQMTPAEVMQTIYSDTDTFLGFISDMFRAVDADLTLNVSIPDSISGGMVPEPLVIDLWLMNGVGYADLGNFSFADPSLTGVYGIDFPAVYTEIFTSEELGAMMDEMLQSQGNIQIEAFEDMSWVNDFVTIARTEDVTVAGEPAATFTAVVDYGAMFQSDVMAQMIDAQMEAQKEVLAADPSMSDMDPAVFDDMSDAIIDAYAMLFDGAILTVNYTIGLDTQYMYATDFNYVMDVDLNSTIAAISAAVPEGEEEIPAAPVPPFSVDFSMSIGQSDVNSVESIPLPEDAQIVPPEVLGMGM